MDFYTLLKGRIASAHEDTEKVFQPSLFSEAFDREAYAHYLLTNYLFFGTHENFLGSFDLPEVVENLMLPSKADMLRHDRQVLNIKAPDENLEPLALGPYADEGALAVALGAAYVSAGAAMGLKMVSKHLLNKPFIAQSGATSFLEAHRTFDGQKWKAFTGLLNEQTDARYQEAIISSALRSFELFKMAYKNAGKLLTTDNLSHTLC